MNKIISITITYIIIIFVTSSCSYQKMNSADQKKFHIKEFEVSGNSRESFIIQKKYKDFPMKIARIKLRSLLI